MAITSPVMAQRIGWYGASFPDEHSGKWLRCRNPDRATMTSTRRRTERTPLPAWVKPRLAALVKKAPDGPDWLHEMKLDGYRMHARLDAGRVKILTRRGNDWTQKYPIITKAIAGLPAQNAYLDGELCGVLPDGKTAFNLIQNATDSGGGSLVFFFFDLLFLDGEDIQACRWATDGESRGCLMARQATKIINYPTVLIFT